MLENELPDKIKDIVFKPTETVAVRKQGKSCRLDLLCMLDTGEIVNIEMQSYVERHLKKRALNYWAFGYASQLQSGDGFDQLKPVICINILDFVHFKDRDSAFNIVTAHVEDPDERYSNDLRLLFVELPKIKPGENMSRKEFWSLFLNPKIPFSFKEKMAMNDAIMSKAVDFTKMFSGDYSARMAYIAEEMARRDYITDMSDARNYGKEEGREEGRQEGRQENCIENAVELMRNGAPLELISKSLKLSKQFLLDLASQNNIPVEQ